MASYPDFLNKTYTMKKLYEIDPLETKFTYKQKAMILQNELISDIYIFYDIREPYKTKCIEAISLLERPIPCDSELDILIYMNGLLTKVNSLMRIKY